MSYLLTVLLFSEMEKKIYAKTCFAGEKQYTGTESQLELLLFQVMLQHLKSNKTLNFPANTWLSRNRDDRQFLCELPVVEAGKPIYPSMCVQLFIYWLPVF